MSESTKKSKRNEELNRKLMAKFGYTHVNQLIHAFTPQKLKILRDDEEQYQKGLYDPNDALQLDLEPVPKTVKPHEEKKGIKVVTRVRTHSVKTVQPVQPARKKIINAPKPLPRSSAKLYKENTVPRLCGLFTFIKIAFILGGVMAMRSPVKTA